MPITVITGGTQAAGTNNGTDVSLTLPTLLEGDCVIVFGGHNVASGQSVIPSGYTPLYDSGDANPTPHFGVSYKFMGATPDTTVTCPGNGVGADGTAYGCYCLRRVDAAVIDQTVVPTGPTTGVNPDLGQIVTQTAGAYVLALVLDHLNGTGDTTITNPTGYTEQRTARGADTNDATVCGALKSVPSPTTENPAAFTGWTAGTWRGLTVAVKLGAFQGTTVLAGSGALRADATVLKQWQGTAVLASSGDLSATSIHFDAGTYDETGATDARTLAARAHTEFEFGLQLDYGALSTDDVLRFRVYAGGQPLGVYDVTPELTVAAVAGGDSATLAGSGALLASASVFIPGSTVLAGSSTLAVNALRYISGFAVLAGSSAMAASASRFITGSAVLAGSSTLASQASLRLRAASVLAATSALNLNALRYISGTAVLDANSALSLNVLRRTTGTAVLAGDSAITAFAAQKFVTNPATLAASSSLILDMQPSGAVTWNGSAVLAGSSALSLNALRFMFGTTVLAGNSALSLNALRFAFGTTVLAGNSAISLNALRFAFGTTVLAGNSAISSRGTLTLVSRAVLPASSTLAALVSLRLIARSTLDGNSALSLDATIAGQAAGLSALLAGNGSLRSAATLRLVGRATLNASGDLSLTGALRQVGRATLNGAGSLASSANVFKQGTARLSASSSLSSNALKFIPAVAEFLANSTLSVATRAGLGGFAVLSGDSLLRVIETQRHNVSWIAAGDGSLYCLTLAEMLEYANAISTGSMRVDASVIVSGHRSTRSSRATSNYGGHHRTNEGDHSRNNDGGNDIRKNDQSHVGPKVYS
jgi:hypothetical protein